MKISLKLAAAVLAASLLAFGCKTSSSEDSSITAPDVGKVDSLTLTGATSTFTDTQTTEAVAFYTSASNALNDFVSTNISKAGALKSAIEAANFTAATKFPNARAAATPKTQTYPYDVDVAAGSGTVKYTGSVTQTVGGIDKSSTAPTANTRYNGFLTCSIAGTVNGTITNATVTSGGHTYVINGIVKNTESINFNFDYLTGTDLDEFSDAKIYLNFGFGLGAGTAISVVREDGLGAKFLISYAANYGKSNIDCAAMNEKIFGNEMENYLLQQNATLSVYDQDNKLISKTSLPMTDAFSTSILYF